jgi:hypothetical protein
MFMCKVEKKTNALVWLPSVSLRVLIISVLTRYCVSEPCNDALPPAVDRMVFTFESIQGDTQASINVQHIVKGLPPERYYIRTDCETKNDGSLEILSPSCDTPKLEANWTMIQPKPIEVVMDVDHTIQPSPIYRYGA